MSVSSDVLVEYLAPRLGASNNAVRQQLSKAGKAGAMVDTCLGKTKHGLVNNYDVDMVIEYFENKMTERGLNSRINDKSMILWQTYIQFLEEFKYDIYRCP